MSNCFWMNFSSPRYQFLCSHAEAALGPGSLFGIATFSHKLGLYDVQGPVPLVKNVFIPPDADKNLTIELEDVMPLLSFLAPVRLINHFVAFLEHYLRTTDFSSYILLYP